MGIRMGIANLNLNLHPNPNPKRRRFRLRGGLRLGLPKVIPLLKTPTTRMMILDGRSVKMSSMRLVFV
jgi:hypothetical protein